MEFVPVGKFCGHRQPNTWMESNRNPMVLASKRVLGMC